MQDKFEITDSELEIMQVLWKNGGQLNLSQIVEELDNVKKRNKNTVKTLVYRLVNKGSISSENTGGLGFLYRTEITENEYLKKENKSFVEKLYKGNVQKLLLNFVEDKAVSKDEIRRLLDILESED